MQKTKNTNQKVVTLMCHGSSSCPEVIMNQDEIFIKDDFDGKVKLTKEQFSVLKEKIHHGEL